MNLSIEDFDRFFEELWGYGPFPWQSRLARRVFDEGWPDCIDLPTASGKTAAIDIAVFVLACQAELATNKRTVGRRIYFTVNRRVIVDEAFDRAKKLAETLVKAEEGNDVGILGEVARALRSLNEEQDKSKSPPLDIVQLRGGIYRDRAWARSITQPIIICTTADQLGSRLLFRGYGVSPSMQPIHAALTACDSLILLDEAHVTKAFSQTLGLLSRYRHIDKTSPPMRFVQMTATPANDVPEEKRFDLKKENWDDLRNEKLRDRRDASKPTTLVPLGKSKSVVSTVIELAMKARSERRKAIGIIVNRVQGARDIEAGIRALLSKQKIKADVHLVIGRMRPIDRDTLQDQLRKIVGPERPEVLENPVFIVATQCLEVGADYDFDALITECASIDALRQRFGRLNRKGRKIEIEAAIVTNDESIKGEDPIYGDAIKLTWEWLWSKRDDKSAVDFGIGKFKEIWDQVGDVHRAKMLAPTLDAAVLLPAHLDALCQTSPQPVPSPDVSYFIHGPQRDNAEVNVCWRADLGDDDSVWPDIVCLLPPSSPECMTVPITVVRKWMGQRYKVEADADIPSTTPQESEESTPSARRVVIWYGKRKNAHSDKRAGITPKREVFTTTDPNEIRPGNTIVIRTQDFGWETMGHIPGAPTLDELRASADTSDQESIEARAAIERRREKIDQGERATRDSRRKVVVRLHPAFPGRAELRGLSKTELRTIMVAQGFIPPEWDKAGEPVPRFDRHLYRESTNDDPDTQNNEVIIFNRLLDAPDRLELPVIDEDDGEDILSESNGRVSLWDHTKHVVYRVDESTRRLSLNGAEALFRLAAQLHDIGKADARFQAMLARTTPYEAMERPVLLAKSGEQSKRTSAEKKIINERAKYDPAFRHEMLSIQIIEHHTDQLVTHAKIDRDLLLHLIAAHHGEARPFAPVVIDDVDDEMRSVHVSGFIITPEQRKNWTPAHRLDSGIAERFWKLTRDRGWWGLAWLESILRLADQQASAAEQEEKTNE